MSIERLGMICMTAAIAAVSSAASARAEVSMSPPFSNGMVLQRGEKVPIYGKAADGEKVTVEFGGGTAETTAGKDGKWRVDIPPGEPGGPFVLTVRGRNTITMKDVYVGDVWVCAGQSNIVMGRKFKPLKDAPEMVRYFTGLGPARAIKLAEKGISRVAPGAELVRDAKRRALALPNTAMAVTFDLTNDDIIPCKTPGDTHPVLFPEMLKPITDRLMKAVRAATYGDDVEWSGPLVDRIVLRNGEATVTFTHVGEGLVVKSKEGGAGRLYGFAVQEKVPADTPMWDKSQWEEVDFKPSIAVRKDGGSRTWAPKGLKPVEARLSDDRKSIVLDVKGLKPPLRIYYATGAVPLGSLYNSADLPAVPFVSDPVKQEDGNAN